MPVQQFRVSFPAIDIGGHPFLGLTCGIVIVGHNFVRQMVTYIKSFVIRFFRNLLHSVKCIFSSGGVDIVSSGISDERMIKDLPILRGR